MRTGVDLLETYDGDLILEGNDLADTDGNTAQTYFQILRLLLNSKKGECLFYPDMGINMDPYTGRPNTEKVGRDLAKLIKNAIAESTVLYASEIEVEPYPVGKYSIAFYITIKSLPGENTGIAVIYDMKDNFVRSLSFNQDDSTAITVNKLIQPNRIPE